nr:hypothetical protein Iba_chr12eCG12910 [Ipomoea batatas]
MTAQLLAVTKSKEYKPYCLPSRPMHQFGNTSPFHFQGFQYQGKTLLNLKSYPLEDLNFHPLLLLKL